MEIMIVVDHLRIGGAERVALDQAYYLADRGHKVTIVQFAGVANQSNPNYLTAEFDQLAEKQIKIRDFSGSHLRQIASSIRLLSKLVPELLIVHSLRAAIILRIAIFLQNVKPIMTVTIHQIPELSAPVQRYKRFLYAQSADRLFACSFAMQEQWVKASKKSLIGRVIFRKKVELLRNGVYLDRLLFREVENNSEEKQNFCRIISLGRNVSWKRNDLLIHAFERVSKLPSALLVMRPDRNPELEMELKSRFGDCVEFKYGQTISQLSKTKGDVHLYPTDSGRHSQSSINVMEMASLGIPSLVSIEGGLCWPELKKVGLIIEVDWNDLEMIESKILFAAKTNFSSEIIRVRQLLSIENNLLEHLKCVESLR